MNIKYTKEILESAVKQSVSWAAVCRLVGAKALTGSQTHIKKVSVKYKLDFSHFTGQGHNKGKTYLKRDALTYCFKGSTEPSSRLKQKLVRDGYKKDQCEKCGISEWLGEKLSLELDHIDSDHFNNEFENLQILCPNCHTVKTKNAGMVKMANTHCT